MAGSGEEVVNHTALDPSRISTSTISTGPSRCTRAGLAGSTWPGSSSEVGETRLVSLVGDKSDKVTTATSLVDPAKSRTKAVSLPGRRRNARPTIWVNNTGERVGRANTTQSHAGRSVPSVRTCTVTNASRRPAVKSSKYSARSSEDVAPTTMAVGIPSRDMVSANASQCSTVAPNTNIRRPAACVLMASTVVSTEATMAVDNSPVA